ncbi:MAG TPA: tetratricopeptide repeat protein [Flavobacteriales bacterium]|nr:tetratricopeptide repeat protein [Flavobacteriales bacterium]
MASALCIDDTQIYKKLCKPFPRNCIHLNMLRLTLISSLCLWLTMAVAVAVNLDSLWGVWNDTSQTDTKRLSAIHDIAWEGYMFSRPDSAFYYANMQYRLAENLGNKESMASALSLQGISFAIRGNYEQALFYIEKGLKINEEIADSMGIAKFLGNIGLIYFNQGSLELTLSFYQKALNIFEELEYKRGMAASYINMGDVYKAQGDLLQALSFIEKGLKLFEELRDKRGISGAYSNIGAINKEKGNTALAMEYYEKSKNMQEEIGNKQGMADSYISLGSIYLEQRNFTQAIIMAEKAIAIAQNIGLITTTKSASELLYEAYKNTGKPVKALTMHELYIKMADSLTRMETKEAAIKLEYQHQFEKEQALADAKHQKEMVLSAEREKRQQLISYAIAIGLVLVLFFAFFIYNRFQLTKKQKKVIEQKNQQITESIQYAKRIQDASLTSLKTIDKYLDDYFIYFKPKDIVSGDFYWVHKLEDEKIMIALADCTGHGVPGGFMSMMSTSLLNEIIIDKGITQVNKVLETMRNQLIQALHQREDNVETRDGLDIALISVDMKQRKVDFAAAGHKIYITGKQGCEEIKGDYFSVGYSFGKEKPFSIKQLQLEEGDTIHLTSDGYVDQFGGDNRKKFGRPTFIQLMAFIKTMPMKEQKTILETTMAKWKGDTEQLDDILVMGVRF